MYLLVKLAIYGVCGDLLRWIRSYFPVMCGDMHPVIFWSSVWCKPIKKILPLPHLHTHTHKQWKCIGQTRMIKKITSKFTYFMADYHIDNWINWVLMELANGQIDWPPDFLFRIWLPLKRIHLKSRGIFICFSAMLTSTQ